MKTPRHSSGGVVDSAIFRVDSGGKIFWVMEEKVGEGDFRFVCTCPLRYNCEHIETVRIHIGRHAKLEKGKNERNPTSSAEGYAHDSYPSMPPARMATLAPPPSGRREKREKTIFNNPEEIEHICKILKQYVSDVISEKIEGKHSGLREKSEELVRNFEGINVTDLLKSFAALRRAILEEKPDPVAVCLGIERVMGAVYILEKHKDKLPVDERLQTTYLGRAWEIGEIERQEDIYLIEIARNSVITPFGIRRSESYYMNAATGDLFIEEKYHPPGGGNPSVGPFPRMLHVNLMTIEPRFQTPSVNLLQYSVLPPPQEGDLLKIKTMAVGAVEEATNSYQEVVGIVKSPYPVFVAFCPLKTRIYKERLIMQDSEGDIIGLAYSSSPYGCLSVEKICSANHLHAICGLLVREGKYLAISPLSLLIENGTGLKMVRIK